MSENARYVLLHNGCPMLDAAELRGQMSALLEQALDHADELHDATAGYLIERGIDEARSQHFEPAVRE